MKTRLKINGVIIVLGLLAIVLFPRVFLRANRINCLGEITEVAGIAFILLGQIVRTSSRGYKAEHSKEGQALIQGGPYAVVRNPMYLGIFLIGTGILLILFQLWVAVIFLCLFLLRYFTLIFKEERKLKAAFPDEYPLYQKKAPRFFPSFHTLIYKDIAECLPLKTKWLKREAWTMFAVLFGVILFELWSDIKNEGIAAYLKEELWVAVTFALFLLAAAYLVKRTAFMEKNGTSKS